MPLILNMYQPVCVCARVLYVSVCDFLSSFPPLEKICWLVRLWNKTSSTPVLQTWMWPCSTETEVNTHRNMSIKTNTHSHRDTVSTLHLFSISINIKRTHLNEMMQTLISLFCSYSFPSFPGEDSDSDSDLSMEEERSLSIPSSESEDNVRLRGRIQRRFKRSNHGERLLTEPAHNGTKGTWTLFLISFSQLKVSDSYCACQKTAECGKMVVIEPLRIFWKGPWISQSIRVITTLITTWIMNIHILAIRTH